MGRLCFLWTERSCFLILLAAFPLCCFCFSTQQLISSPSSASGPYTEIIHCGFGDHMFWTEARLWGLALVAFAPFSSRHTKPLFTQVLPATVGNSGSGEWLNVSATLVPLFVCPSLSTSLSVQFPDTEHDASLRPRQQQDRGPTVVGLHADIRQSVSFVRAPGSATGQEADRNAQPAQTLYISPLFFVSTAVQINVKETLRKFNLVIVLASKPAVQKSPSFFYSYMSASVCVNKLILSGLGTKRPVTADFFFFFEWEEAVISLLVLMWHLRSLCGILNVFIKLKSRLFAWLKAKGQKTWA